MWLWALLLAWRHRWVRERHTLDERERGQDRKKRKKRSGTGRKKNSASARRNKNSCCACKEAKQKNSTVCVHTTEEVDAYGHGCLHNTGSADIRLCCPARVMIKMTFFFFLQHMAHKELRDRKWPQEIRDHTCWSPSFPQGALSVYQGASWEKGSVLSLCWHCTCLCTCVFYFQGRVIGFLKG